MLRQDGKLADNLRQLAVARRVEGEGDVVLSGFCGLGHMLEIKRILRAVGFQRIEGKDHIFGRYRLAILPFGIGAQAIGDKGKIGRKAEFFGKQPVGGGYLIHRV